MVGLVEADDAVPCELEKVFLLDEMKRWMLLKEICNPVAYGARIHYASMCTPLCHRPYPVSAVDKIVGACCQALRETRYFSAGASIFEVTSTLNILKLE